jgi:hypothetical protein
VWNLVSYVKLRTWAERVWNSLTRRMSGPKGGRRNIILRCCTTFTTHMLGRSDEARRGGQDMRQRNSTVEVSVGWSETHPWLGRCKEFPKYQRQTCWLPLLKMCDVLPHSGVGFVEPPWSKTSHFQSCVYTYIYICIYIYIYIMFIAQCYRAHCVIKIFILW